MIYMRYYQTRIKAKMRWNKLTTLNQVLRYPTQGASDGSGQNRGMPKSVPYNGGDKNDMAITVIVACR